MMNNPRKVVASAVLNWFTQSTRQRSKALLKPIKLVPRASFSSTSRIYDTFEKNVVRAKVPDVDIPRQHLFEFVLDQNLESWSNRIGLADAVTGENFTFQEIHTISLTLAQSMQNGLGLTKGDVVALLLPTCPEFGFLLMACSILGCPATTVNPIYTAPEIARQLEMSGAKRVFTQKQFLSTVEEAIEKVANTNSEVVCLDAEKDSQGIISYENIIKSGNPSKVVRPNDFDFEEDILFLPYSSGTTGLPKGVQLTHRNVVSNMAQTIYAQGFNFIPFPTETFQPVTICVLPMFHVFASLVTLFPTLHVGGKVVTLPGFEPKRFIKALEDHKPNFLHLAPPLVSFCANHPDVTPDHLASVSFVMVGAAPVGQALIEKFKEKAPEVTFREGWGMTETSPVGTMTPNNDEVVGSCGVAIPNTEIKIVDLTTGENLGPNERGEFCLRGPQVMKGYLDNEEATKATIKNGWIHTGDIAYYDKTEHFYIVDRLKELIKVKGLQVAPAELEDLLRSHPDIADVAVIGVPHDKFGEVPRAYVVKQNPDLNEETVHAFVNAEVAKFKQLLGGIEFIDAVPKSASGKILRRTLVEQYSKSN